MEPVEVGPADFSRPRMGAYLQRLSKASFEVEFPFNDFSESDVERSLLCTFEQGRVVQLEHLLSPTECLALVAESSKLGYAPVDWEYRPEYRRCDRVVTTNAGLAAELWRRLLLVLQPEDTEKLQPYGYGNRGTWVPSGVNECLRFTKYDPDAGGGHFSAHRDGGFVRDDHNQSILTLMVYLNDVPGPQQGSTKFYQDPLVPYGLTTHWVRPKVGRALLFNHDVWHAGHDVWDDVKYIVRTDIMFRKVDAAPLERQIDLSGHPEYLRAQELYHQSVVLQEAGDPGASTRCYLEAQAIQAALSSTSQQLGPSGPELAWFPPAVWREILGHLDRADLLAFGQASRACARLAQDNQLWADLYAAHWELPPAARSPGYLVTQHWASAFKHRWIADISFRPMIFHFTPENTYVMRSDYVAFTCASKAALVCGHLWCRGSGQENCLVGGALEKAERGEGYWGRPGDIQPAEWLMDTEEGDELSFNPMVLRALMKHHLEIRDADETPMGYHFHWESELLRRPILVMRSEWMTDTDCRYLLDFMLEELAAPYAAVVARDSRWATPDTRGWGACPIRNSQWLLLQHAFNPNSALRRAFVANNRERIFFD